MALIYAFRDATGRWYGDPDGRWHEVHDKPVTSTLAFYPGTDDPGAGSQFAGQTLQVLSAGIGEAAVGEIRYILDDGRGRYATAEVDELLFGDDVDDAWRIGTWPPPGAAAAPASPPSAPPAAGPVPLYWQVSEAGRHYDLTATAGPDGLRIEVLGSDDDGQILSRLDGHLPHGHLSLLARLFLAASANPDAATSSTTRAPSRRSGNSWSAEEAALVARRHHEGADVDAIAAELARTPNSIRYKLYALGLGPFPGTTSSSPRPRQPAHTPAYTMADLREVHPNSHKRWEPEDDARLARRAAEGATVTELMAEFGRNENAITSRLARVSPQPEQRGSARSGSIDATEQGQAEGDMYGTR